MEVVRLAMDIGAMSVRGNHDHEVVRQGLKGRSRGSEGSDMNRDREREGRDREREREREKARNRDREGSENSNISDKDRDSSGGLNNSTKPRSITGDALGGNLTGPGSDIPAPKTTSSRVQQHLELGNGFSFLAFSSAVGRSSATLYSDVKPLPTTTTTTTTTLLHISTNIHTHANSLVVPLHPTLRHVIDTHSHTVCLTPRVSHLTERYATEFEGASLAGRVALLHSICGPWVRIRACGVQNR